MSGDAGTEGGHRREWWLEAARFSLAAFLGVSALGIGRSAGATSLRSGVLAVVVLLVAVVVMVVKYVLSH